MFSCTRKSLQRTVVCNITMTTHGTGENTRTKLRELLVRHHELEQNKNKAQGALLTILFMTQITELKMLLDIGRKHHRFYEFVLALLIASVSLQVCFGMIIIYIGHLQYYKEPHQKKVSFGRRILQCLLCKCRLRTKCCQNNKMKTRRHSYLDVPIGVGAPEGKFEDPLDNMSKDSYDPHEDGCVQFPPKKITEDFPNIEKRKSVLEAANVKLSECVAKILRISNEVEHLEDATKSCPTNPDLQEDLNRMRGDLQIAKRHKMEAEAEWNTAESRMKQTVLACEQWEERQEKAVFKRITRWQQCATYLLYFIMLMNVFVTAFGISGGHFDGSVNTTNHTIN